MKLADKIILLRKQKGWSQEELAAQMDVSRQSVSKWESGISMPDIDKIILLSQIFGTSTDYLLKEDIEEVDTEMEKKTGNDDDTNKEYLYDESQNQLNNRADDNLNNKKYKGYEEVFVSIMEVEEYLQVMKNVASKIALGVWLCIFSVAPMMFLLGFQQMGELNITEDIAAIVGVCLLLFIVAIAVFLFIVNGIKMSKFEFIEKELITIDNDVRKEIQEKSEQFAGYFAKNIAIGVTLCIVSVVPLLLAAIEVESHANGNDALVICMVGVLLIVIATGVYRFVKVGVVKESYDKLLQTGEFTSEKKINNKKNDSFSGVYWLVITAIYLAYSFVTMDWSRSWIIWPVAGVLFAAITIIINSVRASKNK